MEIQFSISRIHFRDSRYFFFEISRKKLKINKYNESYRTKIGSFCGFFAGIKLRY